MSARESLERLTAPPTDDEREALAQEEAERRWPIHPHGVTDTRDVPDLLRHRACFVQGATWASDLRRAPITDEMVTAALARFNQDAPSYRARMRAALEAAREVQQ